MEDIKDLSLNVPLGEIHRFMLLYEQRRDFVYATIWQSFDESERELATTIRIITLSTEIILLNSIFKDYINEDDLTAKNKTLNEELENMKELRTKNEKELRKGNNESDYERVFNVLSQL